MEFKIEKFILHETRMNLIQNQINFTFKVYFNQTLHNPKNTFKIIDEEIETFIEQMKHLEDVRGYKMYEDNNLSKKYIHLLKQHKNFQKLYSNDTSLFVNFNIFLSNDEVKEIKIFNSDYLSNYIVNAWVS